MSEKLYFYKRYMWLYHQYVKLNKSLKEVAAECDVSYVTINVWLRKFKIPLRPPGRPGMRKPKPEIEPGWVWLIKNGFRHRVPIEVQEEYNHEHGA